MLRGVLGASAATGNSPWLHSLSFFFSGDEEWADPTPPRSRRTPSNMLLAWGVCTPVRWCESEYGVNATVGAGLTGKYS